jgi:hypothetical protein
VVLAAGARDEHGVVGLHLVDVSGPVVHANHRTVWRRYSQSFCLETRLIIYGTTHRNSQDSGQ